jgi:cobaltochelatase CobN
LPAAATANWLADSQGLRPRDIAMQVVLPEMDGRIMTRAMSFKGLAHRCELTQTDVISYQAEPDRVAWIAELAWRWCRLRSKPAAQKKAALILANYPGSEARMGSGVGLDTPESVIALLDQLARDGWQLGMLLRGPTAAWH